MKIGNKIREFRNEKGITHKDLSEVLKVNQSTYNKLENGEMDFKSEQIILISKFFKKTVAEIFGEQGNVYIQNNQKVESSGHIERVMYNTDEKLIQLFTDTLITQQNTLNKFFEQNTRLQDNLINLMEKIVVKNNL